MRAGTPFDAESVVPLSDPVEVWYFDLGSSPDASASKTVDLTFSNGGRFNAVMFWFKLHLYGDVHVSTGLDAVKQGEGMHGSPLWAHVVQLSQGHRC